MKSNLALALSMFFILSNKSSYVITLSPKYALCNLVNQDSSILMLNTLNGLIKGSCFDIPMNFGNKQDLLIIPS